MRTGIFLVVLGIASFTAVGQLFATVGTPIPTFEISGSGTFVHFDPPIVPGVKPFVTKVSAAQVALCIAGTGNGCISGNLELDGGGKAYLFLPFLHTAYIGTKADCSNATKLQGNTAGDGTFMFAGHHELSHSDVNLQGKVTFDKTFFSTGTPFVPIAIKKASLIAVSSTLFHYAVGTFFTVVEITPAFLESCPP
jgi:hypothetical protein